MPNLVIRQLTIFVVYPSYHPLERRPVIKGHEEVAIQKGRNL